MPVHATACQFVVSMS